MLYNFNLDEVKLLDKDFAYRRDLVKKYIVDFDINRLMHTFRINAGIPSDAEPLGGWEDVGCGLRGHFVGHYLSSCSKFAFADKDEFLENKAKQIVEIMELCAKPNGYLSAFEESNLDVLEIEENRNVWAPYYTLHKILQGLVDCYNFLHNEKALILATNLAHYIHGRFAKLSEWKIDGILRCTKVNPVNEFGGIGDTLYSLYEITQDDKIYELANIFDREYFIDKLAADKDVLANLHANTHLPMIIAAMHRYNISGEIKYKTATINFYKYLIGRTFANGNNSSKATAYIKGGVSEKSEHWGDFNDLSDALTGGESESCCAHNTEKIVQQLYEWSEQVEYLNHIERLKYNAVLNSCSNQTGLSQYHQPMGNGASKKFSGPYDTFWCCTASGIEAMSEIQKNIWFKKSDGVLLNMFLSSTVVWKEMNATITQYSDFPDNLNSTLIIQVKKPTEFKLMLKEAAIDKVKVNSEEVNLIKENGYIIIKRIFNNNDKIEISIKATLSLVSLKGSDDMVAAMYGPVVLAELGHNPCFSDITKENLEQRLTRTKDSQLTFITDVDEKESVKFIPMYRVEDEVYTVYFSLNNNLSNNNSFSFAKDGREAYK